MSLKAFMNPIIPQNEKVVVSNRFMEGGKPEAFEIRPILQAENDKLMKKHTKKDKKTHLEVFDRQTYISELTATAVVYPDLKDAELQKRYEALGEAQCLKNMLLIGEYGTLVEAVQSLSGLDEDMNDLVEEAKN